MTSANEYEIMASTAVYKKVCGPLTSRMKAFIDTFQMVQHLADSWRNVIGSSGIAVILAFCDSQEELENSDEERVKFANFWLEGLRFLYRDTNDEDKKVRHTDHPCSIVHVSNNFQKWQGLFHGPFILRVFTTHLSAINGFMQVPVDLHDKPSPNAVGALGLAAASVRAFHTALGFF